MQESSYIFFFQLSCIHVMNFTNQNNRIKILFSWWFLACVLHIFCISCFGVEKLFLIISPLGKKTMNQNKCRTQSWRLAGHAVSLVPRLFIFSLYSIQSKYFYKDTFFYCLFVVYILWFHFVFLFKHLLLDFLLNHVSMCLE